MLLYVFHLSNQLPVEPLIDQAYEVPWAYRTEGGQEGIGEDAPEFDPFSAVDVAFVSAVLPVTKSAKTQKTATKKASTSSATKKSKCASPAVTTREVVTSASKSAKKKKRSSPVHVPAAANSTKKAKRSPKCASPAIPREGAATPSSATASPPTKSAKKTKWRSPTAVIKWDSPDEKESDSYNSSKFGEVRTSLDPM